MAAPDRASDRDSVRRFDDRVADYVRWRPGYPAAVATTLAREEGLAVSSDVVDVGAGTGKLSVVLLDAGHRVLGIEPNEAMRAAAEAELGGREGWSQQDGTAEATGLPDASADLVIAGQAFHWFEPKATRAEFLRVLRPGGHVALVWNDRRIHECPILVVYEALLREHAADYRALEARDSGGVQVAAFFAPQPVTEHRFANAQQLTWEGLRGRVLSASYVPREGPAHDAILGGMRAAFEQHAVDGVVDFAYDTRLFLGRLG